MLLLTTFVVFPSPYLVVLFLLTKKISYIAEWQNLMKFYCLLSCFSSFFVDLLLGILDYLHEARKNFHSHDLWSVLLALKQFDLHAYHYLIVTKPAFVVLLFSDFLLSALM